MAHIIVCNGNIKPTFGQRNKFGEVTSQRIRDIHPMFSLVKFSSNYKVSSPHVNHMCAGQDVSSDLFNNPGGGPRVVVSTAAFHTRVRGSVPVLGSLKKAKMFLPHPFVKTP